MMEDERRQYLVIEAIVFAIEGMSRMPDEFRPDNNIADLKEILHGMVSPKNLANYEWEARRRVDILLGKLPDSPVSNLPE